MLSLLGGITAAGLIVAHSERDHIRSGIGYTRVPSPLGFLMVYSYRCILFFSSRPRPVGQFTRSYQCRRRQPQLALQVPRAQLHHRSAWPCRCCSLQQLHCRHCRRNNPPSQRQALQPSSWDVVLVCLLLSFPCHHRDHSLPSSRQACVRHRVLCHHHDVRQARAIVNRVHQARSGLHLQARAGPSLGCSCGRHGGRRLLAFSEGRRRCCRCGRTCFWWVSGCGRKESHLLLRRARDGLPVKTGEWAGRWRWRR